MKATMLHFAYASNMSRGAMRRRCSEAKELGPAMLLQHRFMIMANGYASVVRASGEVVHGILWRITLRDLAVLDAYENVAGGLYRRATLPVVQGTTTTTALVYLGSDQREGVPRPGYMELIIAAARECGFPADYVASLARRLPHGWRSAAAADVGDMR